MSNLPPVRNPFGDQPPPTYPPPGPAGYPQPPQNYPVVPQDDFALRMIVPVGRSVWAILAGYFGLFSVLILPAPFALLFGILGLRAIRKDPKLGGAGRCYFGIVMGLLGCLCAGGSVVIAILDRI